MSTGTTNHVAKCPPPGLIIQGLWEGGDLWILDNLEITGDEDWLMELITMGSCMVVTDGS